MGVCVAADMGCAAGDDLGIVIVFVAVGAVCSGGADVGADVGMDAAGACAAVTVGVELGRTGVSVCAASGTAVAVAIGTGVGCGAVCAGDAGTAELQASPTAHRIASPTAAANFRFMDMFVPIFFMQSPISVKLPYTTITS